MAMWLAAEEGLCGCILQSATMYLHLRNWQIWIAGTYEAQGTRFAIASGLDIS